MILLVLAGGIGATVCLCIFTDKIHSMEQAKRLLDIPMIGSLDYVKKKSGQKALLISDQDTDHVYEEAVDRIVTSIRSEMSAEGYKTLMVGSIKENDGKSTVTANIALNLARRGKKVVLVDCDMRHPSLAKIFDATVDPKEQFSEYLLGKCELDQVLKQMEVQAHPMDCIWQKKAVAKPYRLLGSERFISLIDQLKEQFDYVVMDTPPLELIRDAEIISETADAMLMVMRQDEVHAVAVNDAVDLLEENGDKPETATYTYTTDDGLAQYKSDGKAAATSYSDFAKFGFSLNAAEYVPGTYAIVFEATDGAATIVKSEATMIVSNPKAEDIFKLVPDFTTANVLQVIGNYATVANKVVYDLEDGILAPDFAGSDVTYIDLDHKAWEEAMGADTEMGAIDWIDDLGRLSVYQNAWNGDDTKANEYMLNKERNIRATYTLYGNAKNTIDYDFKVIVKSSVYTADGSNVTVKAITGAFGKEVNMTSNISAVYALGINKGKALTLFGNAGGSTEKDVTDYDAPKTDAAGKYVVNTDATPIEIAKADLIKFGMTVDAYTALGADDKFFLTVENNDVTVGSENSTLKGWETIMTEVNKYYTYNNGTWGDKDGLSADEKAARDASAEVALFKAYKDKLAYDTKKETVTTQAKPASDEIKSVTFAWDDTKLAEKFVTSTTIGTDGKFTAKAEADIKASDLVNGKAELKVNMKVTDKWGMVMTKTYTVTIKK